MYYYYAQSATIIMPILHDLNHAVTTHILNGTS